MSAIGYRQAALEQQRREQLRLEQVRQEGLAILENCEEAMREMREAAVQQFAAPELNPLRKELERLRVTLATSPDTAVPALREAQHQLVDVINRATAQAAAWSDERARAQKEIARARAQAQVARKVSGAAGEPLLRALEVQIETAERLGSAGQHSEAARALGDASAMAAAAREAGLDESVRKEIVRGLLSTLKSMGFVVEGPRKQESTVQGGVVVMIGRMPSGRMARFEVQLDGRFAFDLDGYEGRACAVDLEGIEKVLEERFGVHLGPPQVTWKNPDRLSKGALDNPVGGQHRGSGGGR